MLRYAAALQCSEVLLQAYVLSPMKASVEEPCGAGEECACDCQCTGQELVWSPPVYRSSAGQSLWACCWPFFSFFFPFSYVRGSGLLVCLAGSSWQQNVFCAITAQALGCRNGQQSRCVARLLKKRGPALRRRTRSSQCFFFLSLWPVWGNMPSIYLTGARCHFLGGNCGTSALENNSLGHWYRGGISFWVERNFLFPPFPVYCLGKFLSTYDLSFLFFERCKLYGGIQVPLFKDWCMNF